MRDIQKALEEHKQAVTELYPEDQILGVFLYGSQNYNLATEKSDVDTKAIIIPTTRQLIFDPVKTQTLDLPNGEKCVVMSIAHWVKNLQKQSLNYLETLFTKYRWINPKYKTIWDKTFEEWKDEIADCDLERGIRSAAHQAINALREKQSGKKLGMGYMLRKFIYERITLEPFSKSIWIESPLRNCIIELKEDKTFCTSRDFECLIQSIQKLIEGDLGINRDENKINALDAKMEQAVIQFINSRQL